MASDNNHPGFWEKAFTDKKEMWGFEPAKSANIANDLFVQQGVKKVLIPGIGYGRNAQLFRESGMEVTGIEISPSAIEMARKQYGTGMTIYQGSVTDMPFDDQLYDGIFCYALIHLLGNDDRAKLIRDCYRQLIPGGTMIFTTISKKASTYGQGKEISPDRYEQFGGVTMFFYDEASIRAEFEEAGLVQISEVQENFPFLLIQCTRQKP